LRSRKNAIDDRLWSALRAQLAAASDDPDVHAVVLTGAGGDFCAGADLSTGLAGEHPLDRMRRINEVAMLLHELSVPSVALVDGAAVGAGWNLALGCDLVVATPQARFSQIFAKRGLSLDFGGAWLLPKLVGLQQAKRLALLARCRCGSPASGDSGVVRPRFLVPRGGSRGPALGVATVCAGSCTQLGILRT
jgi:enoyl-CoA hydratase/carnithine racemase